MRERLKRVVLKTTVRETVPGVRIPLPPPRSLDCREIPPPLPLKYAKQANFSGYFFENLDCRGHTARRRRGSVLVFLWRAHVQSGFREALGRMQCDQKPGIRSERFDLVSSFLLPVPHQNFVQS